MKANPNGQLDEKALMSSMNSMMAQMMSGGGPLAGLAGIGGPPPSTRALPRAGPRKKKKAHK
jgi:hypothetical protein